MLHVKRRYRTTKREIKVNHRKPCVIGNWKMNGSKPTILNLIKELLAGASQVKVLAGIEKVVCPPTIYLEMVEALLQPEGQFKLGAQNTYCEPAGAFTGEISPDMLREFGCQYVILGHSERRQHFFESNELIARKFMAAYHTGLTPVVCVGETQAERTEGRAFEVIESQLAALLSQASTKMLANSIIAYEPVWAIGTGQTATPDQAEEVHAHIRYWLANQDKQAAETVRLLYGGSVNAANAARLFSEPNIDGALVGGGFLRGSGVFNYLSKCNSKVKLEKVEK